MNNVTRLGLACVLALAFTGCYKHSYTVGAGGNVDADPAYDEWESHWFFGIIGETEVDVKTVCPSGNATIKDKHTFLNGLVGALIGIVWAPTTVEVYCDGAGAAPAAAETTPEAAPASEGESPVATITLSPEQMRRIALKPETLDWARHVSSRKAAELETAILELNSRNRLVAKTRSTATY